MFYLGPCHFNGTFFPFKFLQQNVWTRFCLISQQKRTSDILFLNYTSLYYPIEKLDMPFLKFW